MAKNKKPELELNFEPEPLTDEELAQEQEELELPHPALEAAEEAAEDAAEEEKNEADPVDVVKRYVNDDEDEEDEFGEISFRSILGGDILQSRFFLRQIVFILFVAVLLLFYTGNRYSSQQELIEIERLKMQLQTERYNVLTQSSELLNLMRQSNIEKTLRLNGDSALVTGNTRSPYELPREE